MYEGVRFYAVQTNPRCEERARRGLIAAGFIVYLPMETRWCKVAARLVTRAKRENRPKERRQYPLMPGYLFVQVDHSYQAVASIRAVNGVNCLVGIGNAPTPIPAAVIEAIREAEAAGEFDHTKPVVTYAPGDQVKIRSGPFSGFIAKVIAETEAGRVRVLFESGFLKGELGFEGEQVERAA